MINDYSINAAYDLAEKIGLTGRVLRPLSGTPLEILTMASCPRNADANPDSNDGNVLSVPAKWLDTDEHNAAMEHIVSMSVKGVEAAIHNAKNVVNPIILNVVSKYEDFVSNSINATNNAVSIEPDFLPAFWESPVLQSLVERFDGVAMQKVKLNIKFPSLTDEEIEASVSVGNVRFDKEVSEYIALLKTKEYGVRLADVYKTVFSFEGQGVSGLEDLIDPFTNNRDVALCTFILANKFMNSAPEGMSVSLSEYRAYVSSILEQAGRSVCRILQKNEADIKNNVLVTGYPTVAFGSSQRYPINVNGAVYNRWLKEGGQPEVIFGAYVSDRQRSYTALLERKDEYLAAWQREKKLLDTKIRLELRYFKEQALTKAYFTVLNELPDEVRTGSVTEMSGRVSDLLNGLKTHNFENVHELIRMLVCRSIFNHTDAEVILVGIDEAVKAHPELDIREAALLAVIDYVGTWVASQIKSDLV